MIKKIDICPKNKKIKLKSKKCKKCEHYNARKWYVAGKEVEVFCSYDMTDAEKQYLR